MPSARRRGYIDAARGVAVLLMIEAHTLDAWTRPADTTTVFYRDASILGGFAAPLFLFLAGVAVVLAAAHTAQRTGWRLQGAEAMARRGLEILILAFLFRLQAFIVSPGSDALALFRVDILNVMGPAMVAAALVWATGASTRWLVLLYGAAATLVAMLTPIVRAAGIVGLLPIWMQWYVRPAGELTVFTLFPWAGFVFAGAAAGVLLATSRGSILERRAHVALASAGAILVAVGFYTAARPTIYSSSSFWTSSPTWFVIRVGIVTTVLSAIYFATARGDRQGVPVAWQLPLEKLGHSSLFIYWIHVELVYGYASWFWKHRLPLWATALAYVTFCILIYRATGWRDRIVVRWKGRVRQTDLVSAASGS